MDTAALAALEFRAVAEKLADATSTTPGTDLAWALTPSGDPAEVARRHALTAEAIALLEASVEPPLRGIADVRATAERAARGGLLSPSELSGIGSTVAGALAARAALDGQAEEAPLLNELAAGIEPGLRGLAETIGSRVEADGSDLKDAASPELRRLRRQLREGRGRIADELRRLARRSGVREHLQEDFITQRGGRPVLAVKAGSRSSVPGVVHDASSSGETLFVEPFEIVELSNRQSEAAGAEREEAERILRDLTAAVGERAGEVRILVEAIGEIDLAIARGALSRRWRGAPVKPSDQVSLVGARHPLLDPAIAVPIDLELGSLRALVISGPNTGGKTVALKTLGLAALLHQAGLRPPAARAALPVFDAVLADIGDPQSIEMSLSTFSGHVRALIAVLNAATERSLVLIDEVSAGTDPVEGSALAQALVARLAGQARLTVVTTHHPELKEWASATEGVANAATGLDPVTHEPLYRISLGRPGTSHALATAERLGLDPAVVDDARARVAPERLRIADLLAEAEAAERAAAATRSEAASELAEAASRTDSAQRREDELAAEIERVRASSERERELAAAAAERELGEARAELAALREEIRAARRLQERAGRAATATERDRDRRLGEASNRATRAEQALRSVRRPVPLAGPLAPGDPVEAPDLGVRGTIAAIEDDEAEVVGAGGQRIRIPVARLRADDRGGSEAEPQSGVKIVAAARSDVSDQLDLRGRRADEAREAVRAFVDEAALAGLDTVRIVHGRGTGAVRAAVREELGRHPLVEGFETDSADGATDATLGRASEPSVSRFIGRENLRKRLGPLEGAPGRTTYEDGIVRIEPDEGEALVVRPPFGLAHEGRYDEVQVSPLLEAIAADHVVGALLVRLGGYAVGVFEGERLVASKVGSRFVKGRHKKGGSSANRFRRRREEQARALVEEAAEVAATLLAPWRGRVEHVALGGDRSAVEAALAAEPDLAWLRELALPRFFTVPEPRQRVLERLPYDLYSAELLPS